MKAFEYLRLKWIAIGWLVLGRNARALPIFDRMLEGRPDDAYALASRAHLLGQAGRTDAASAAKERIGKLK